MMLDLKPTMDEEHYPTEETERRIREYEGDARELLAAVREVWAYPDYWQEEDATDILDKPTHRYNMSTAGWSGNETLMAALEDCWMFWIRFWVARSVGGHYIFEIGPGDATVLKTERKPCATCGRY
jgi:hypothetical protein